MPYPNFTTADFTPSTTDGVFNIANPLGNSALIDILPDRATMLAAPYNIAESSLPNTDSNIARIEDHNIGETLSYLPQVLAEIYTNDSNALIKDSDLANTVISDKLRANAQYIRAYWTAAQTMASWFHHQKIGHQGPGSTYANPLDVPFNDAQKARFIGDLGCSPDPGMLHANYTNKARWDPAVNNTFFNLGYGDDAFSWDASGNLTLRDTYVFEGIGDFGVAPDKDISNMTPVEAVITVTKAILITGTIGVKATQIAVTRALAERILNMFGADLGDDNRPFRNHASGPLTALLGVNPAIGNVADMHIKTTWTPQELATHNPCLFAAAMQAGLIPAHVLTMVKAEKGMGGNSNGLPGMTDNAPVNGCNNPTDLIGSPPAISFGGAATYVKPFTSWLQMVDDANFKLGPYAKVGSLPGRLVLITDSPGFGEVGFWIQRWDVHNDGSVIAANNYQTKNEWFNSAGKTLLSVRFLHLPDRPLIKTLVATCGYAHGGNQDTVYQTTVPLNTASAGSQTLAALISSATPSSFTLL